MTKERARSRPIRGRLPLVVVVAASATGSAATGCGNDDGGAIIDSGLSADAQPSDGADVGTACQVTGTFSSLHDGLFGTPTCVLSGCHDRPTQAGLLDMSQGPRGVFEELLLEGTGAPEVRAQIPNRVTPNNPSQSFLWRKITEADPPGFGSRMPLGGILSPCEIDAVRSWIENGATND